MLMQISKSAAWISSLKILKRETLVNLWLGCLVHIHQCITIRHSSRHPPDILQTAPRHPTYTPKTPPNISASSPAPSTVYDIWGLTSSQSDLQRPSVENLKRWCTKFQFIDYGWAKWKLKVFTLYIYPISLLVWGRNFVFTLAYLWISGKSLWDCGKLHKMKNWSWELSSEQSAAKHRIWNCKILRVFLVVAKQRGCQ